MQLSTVWLQPLYEDMKTAPLVQPTPKGGNHPLWNIGHMAYSESNILHNYILGNPSPIEDWKERFGGGSQPSTSASDYADYESILKQFEATRAETLAYLGTITDEDLEKPAANCPEEYQAFFGTIGQCLAVLTTHYAFHAGQVADCRRADGREILMA